jgi:RNase P/RNase MRP subunit POP5
MALIVDINQSTADKALYTSAVIRGNRVDMINNYVHHHVIGESAANDSRNIIESLSGSGVTDRPSTRSETLTKRQPGSKPINFDPVSSAYRGAKMTLTDFHMTSAVRVVTGTIRRMKETIKADEKSTRDQNDAVYALDKAIKEALNITFVNSFSEYTDSDKLIQRIRTIGYYSSLASIPRAAAELGSNLNYAIFRDPGALVLASNYTTFAYSSDLLGFLGNIGSEASTRIAGNDMLTGKYAEGGLMDTFGKSGTSNATSKVVDYISFIKKYTTDKIAESSELISEFLVSSPDKAISKPFYLAVFAREFEKKTGVKLTEADMKEMSEGTSKYLSPEYSSAVESSRRKADTDITRMSASNNSFNMVLRNAPRKSDSVFWAAYRAANSFMSKHLLTEHGTMRSAVASLFHSGDIDKRTANAILAASITRMVSYSVLSSVLYNLFDTIVSNIFNMETEEDDEELSDLTLRSIVSVGVNIIARRSIGNIPFIPIAFGIEALNEEYGDDLRSGEDYDPYENSVAYAQISKKDLETKSLPEIVAKTSAGPLGPLVGSSTRAVKLTHTAFFSETSKQSTKEKATNELTNRMSFEVAGNLNMLPLYKDIRRIILKDMFSEMDSDKGNDGLQFTNEDINRVAKTNPELARQLREIKKQHEKIK